MTDKTTLLFSDLENSHSILNLDNPDTFFPATGNAVNRAFLMTFSHYPSRRVSSESSSPVVGPACLVSGFEEVLVVIVIVAAFTSPETAKGRRVVEGLMLCAVDAGGCSVVVENRQSGL